MGVSGPNDMGAVQGVLFDQEDRQKQARLDAVADEIRGRLGAGLLRRGSSLRDQSGDQPGTDGEKPIVWRARRAVDTEVRHRPRQP
jgi:hypothetical protein